VYWPDTEALFQNLGLSELSDQSLEQPGMQERFLWSLARLSPETEAFGPAQIGFRTRAEEVQARERFRQNHCSVTFLGLCSSRVLLATLETVSRRIKPGGQIEVQFKQWDALDDWALGQQLLNDVVNSVHSKASRFSILFFSSLRSVPPDFWEYVYQRPCIRLGWTALDLAFCRTREEMQLCCRESLPLKNLETLADSGIWPHVVLPATDENVDLLPEAVNLLAGLTRGGTIDIVPAPLLLPQPLEAAPPQLDKYIASLVAIYKNDRIAVRRVGPQCWVALRVNQEVPLISSAEAAGAALVVTADGELYPSESTVGLPAWHLGNLVEAPEAIRWERLDALPEMFSNLTKPEPCQNCEWRYRCGGVDCSVSLLGERPQCTTDPHTLFQLYCAPRKALFEEALWDSVVDSAQHHAKAPRELLELSETGIKFVKAPEPVKN
jgi:radical SAM protein with 4Fe4S-binding SPASM domain